jgi:hypothetical protein
LPPMRSAVTWLSASALMLVFVWAAAAKVVRFRAWRRALAGYGLHGATERLAAPAVPALEAAAALTLAFVSIKVGAALSLVLLGGFSLAVLRARAQRGNRLPCGCFGRTKARDYRLMLGRNAVLVIPAAAVLLSEETHGLLFGMEVPAAGEIIPALLAALGIGIVVFVLWQASNVLMSLTRRAGADHEDRSPAAVTRRGKTI